MTISQRNTPRLAGVGISLQVYITRGRTWNLNTALPDPEVHTAGAPVFPKSIPSCWRGEWFGVLRNLLRL